MHKIILSAISISLFFLSCHTNKKNISVGDKPTEFSMTITDSARHKLTLTKDKLYLITVIQKGVDVELFLLNSKNEVIKEKDSPNGTVGPEQFYFYCEKTDDYSLKIKPFLSDENKSGGKYSIEISEVSTKIKVDLDKTKYVEDFDVFRKIFEKANSGLYKYHSKQEVDSVFSANKNKINEATSYREFYNLMWNVIDYTGSCHNSLRFPQNLRILLRRKKVFFPIPLKYIEGKLYPNFSYGDLSPEAEIISVNGVKAGEFATQISNYRSTDGFNKTSKYSFIETNWATNYIYMAYGEKEEFIIKYKDKEGIKSLVAKSVTDNTYLDNYNQRYSKKYEGNSDNNKKYSYRELDSLGISILKIQSFSVGEIGSEGYANYASFLDSVFIGLKNSNKLIVDIRGNGGGNGDPLMLLTSYFTKRKVKNSLNGHALFKKVPYPQFYVGSVESMETNLSEYLSEFKNGKYYENEKFNPYWKPNKNAYTGSFILLIDPFVASAASHLAAHIKSEQRAVVIGEETGGGYYGHTGHIPIKYELPNSKLILTFSIIDLEQDVVELASQKHGNGVMPDFEVIQSHEDFLNNKDTQLDYAIEKIITNTVYKK